MESLSVDTVFLILGYSPLSTIHSLLLTHRNFSSILVDGKLFSRLTLRVPHRITINLTLPQVFNLCRSPHVPGCQVITKTNIMAVFLKNGRAYEVDFPLSHPPHPSDPVDTGIADVIDISASGDCIWVLSKNTVSCICGFLLRGSHSLSFDAVQVMGYGNPSRSAFILANDGRVFSIEYKWEDRGYVLVTVPIPSIISHMMEAEYVQLVDVDGKIWDTKLMGPVEPREPTVIPTEERMARLKGWEVDLEEVEQVYGDDACSLLVMADGTVHYLEVRYGDGPIQRRYPCFSF